MHLKRTDPAIIEIVVTALMNLGELLLGLKVLLGGLDHHLCSTKTLLASSSIYGWSSIHGLEAIDLSVDR